MKERERDIRITINYLVEERERIESTGCPRPDEDFQLTHQYITDEISRLHLELFKNQYQTRFGDKINDKNAFQ